MSSRGAQWAFAALAALALGTSTPACAANAPAELAIGWVNVGAGSNEALLFADHMVEKNLPNAKVK
jgi:hypothetical protein